MVDLEQLEAEYRELQEQLMNDRDNVELQEEYTAAKQAFADARQAQRRVEELDPDHPRGQVFAAATNEVDEDEFEGNDL